MSAIKSLLVHLDASPRAAVRLRVAQQVAQQHEAALTALYAVTPSILALPFYYEDQTGALLTALQDLDDTRAKAARQIFDDANVRGDMHWTQLPRGRVAYAFALEAMHADLMVLGQFERDTPGGQGVPADFVESTLIASGKPALVVPSAGNFESIGRDVLLARRPTPEAARALTAALPLLTQAGSVHITQWGVSEERPTGALELEEYLRLHGVDAKVERHASVPPDIGEGLLSLACDASADLLVMGCYGHSRAREVVLGGATRTVLRSMTLPVLMAH
jgi:nucleotide-binding universal stress UspA family protein